MATLWDYQNQLRKIAEHRTSGAEQEILAVYSSVLQRLQSIVGRYYTVYSNGEGTLSAADLRLAGQYKGFLQDVLRGLEQLSEPQQEAIRRAVESAYTVCYDGMAAAVKEAASGSASLQNALHGLSASTPETVAHIVEHPMQKLTLSHVLQKKRRQITHKIRQTLSVGLANGDSYPQMANRIADALHGDYKKAIRVVRTEANRAINRGFQDVSEEAAHLLQGSEYLEVKEWCSAEDGDVRDAHRKLDGKVIPATEAFEIDGKKAQCPGGFGVAELDINCRCFLKYALVKREDFEKKHGKIKGETLTSEDAGGIIEAERPMAAKTFEKAAEYAKSKLGLSIEKISDLPVEKVNQINNTIWRIYRDVPVIRGSIDEVLLEPMKEIAAASFRWNGDTPQFRLKLSRELFSGLSMKELEDNVQACVKSGYFTPKEGLYGVFKHEAVHFAEYIKTLEKYHSQKEAVKKSLDEFELAKQVMHTAFVNCELDETTSVIENYLSEYAAENPAEFIAEAFSSTDDNVLVNEVKRLLFKKWGIQNADDYATERNFEKRKMP